MSKPQRERGPKPAYNVHVYNFRVLTTYVLILSLFCVCVCVHSFVLLVRNRICDDIPVNSKPMFFICFLCFFQIGWRSHVMSSYVSEGGRNTTLSRKNRYGMILFGTESR